MWLLKLELFGIISFVLIILITLTNADDPHLEYAPEYEHPEYAFSYGVKDLHTGDVKSQWESRDNGIIKGHYSVLEPDGSIRTVDYTADAKNGFNAVVKTHGANSHPVTETPHSEYDTNSNDDTSQSKINHYSKDQEHIVLSSDLKPIKKPIADLTHAHPKIPGLIELRPHARIKQIPMDSIHQQHHHSNYKQKHHSNVHNDEYSEYELTNEYIPSSSSRYKKVHPYELISNNQNDDNEWKALTQHETSNNYYSKSSINDDYKINNRIPEPYQHSQQQQQQQQQHQQQQHLIPQQQFLQRKPNIRNTDFIGSKTIIPKRLIPLPNNIGYKKIHNIQYYNNNLNLKAHHHNYNSNKVVNNGAVTNAAGITAGQSSQRQINQHHPDYSSYFHNNNRVPKSKKFLRNLKEGPVVFPIENNRDADIDADDDADDDEEIDYENENIQSNEQRTASARMVKSMFRRDKKHMIPTYARFNSNFYYRR